MKPNNDITMKTKHALYGLLSGLLLLAAGTLTTNASTTIGPGAALANPYTGDGGAPTNVDRGAPASISAGTYNVTDFDVKINNVGGGVTPFLAIGSPSSYTTIWFGPTFTPSSTGVQNISYTLGTQQFTLPSGQTVYAGFDSVGFPTVAWGGAGLTDHNGPDGMNVTSVGQTLSGFTHPGLGRQYHFDIVVEQVPEPTSALLLLGSGAMLLLRRRRRA